MGHLGNNVDSFEFFFRKLRHFKKLWKFLEQFLSCRFFYIFGTFFKFIKHFEICGTLLKYVFFCICLTFIKFVKRFFNLKIFS